MPERGSDEKRESRMERLARYCLPGAQVESDGEKVRLSRVGAGAQVFDGGLVGEAERRGLIERVADSVRTCAAGRAYVRRAAAAREESDASAFQNQHRVMVLRQAPGAEERDKVRINLAESPLAAMARLKARDGRAFLEEDALMAGERLRSDFTRGQMQPRISANWEAGVSSGGPRAANGIADLTDAAMTARQRAQGALRSVGPELSGVLLDVCCFLKGLETVERERQWPARSAKLMLRTALASLSRHYGYRR